MPLASLSGFFLEPPHQSVADRRALNARLIDFRRYFVPSLPSSRESIYPELSRRGVPDDRIDLLQRLEQRVNSIEIDMSVLAAERASLQEQWLTLSELPNDWSGLLPGDPLIHLPPVRGSTASSRATVQPEPPAPADTSMEDVEMALDHPVASSSPAAGAPPSSPAASPEAPTSPPAPSQPGVAPTSSATLETTAGAAETSSSGSSSGSETSSGTSGSAPAPKAKPPKVSAPAASSSAEESSSGEGDESGSGEAEAPGGVEAEGSGDAEGSGSGGAEGSEVEETEEVAAAPKEAPKRAASPDDSSSE